jgi:alkanesulfonate monooxygenase SsuD/methylene tetrahydromethanopterin reductase-like flavin-dependent oxidoreductase (luciferase family)
MSEPMRLVVRLPHSYAAAHPSAIRRVAEAAEELGYWGISVQDHLIVDPTIAPCRSGQGDNRDVYEAFQVLSWVAAATRRVKLLTTVIVVGFRHPVMLAKEAATLDALSEGRLILGLGVGALRKRRAAEGFKLTHHAGVATREFDALGVNGSRGPLAEETLRVLDACWTQSPASFEGPTVRFRDLDMWPRPVQRPRPPIWIGGRSEAAMRRVALLADGWIPSHEAPQHFAWGRRRILELAAEAGRPAPTGWGTNIDIALGRSSEAAEAEMARWFGHLFESRQAMVDATLTGTPERVLEQLGRWRRAGLEVADLKFVPRDVDATLQQMRLVAEEVIPALPALDR